MRSEREGALTPTFVASDPDVQTPTGRFWIDRAAVPCEFASRQDELRALWRVCADMSKTDAF
jgi:hypothetical protein